MQKSKLIRDNIPDIITKSNKVPHIHIADTVEYIKALFIKLNEEIEEFKENSSIEELSDIYEVLEAIQVYYHINQQKLNKIKAKKADKNGKFNKRIILDSVT